MLYEISMFEVRTYSHTIVVDAPNEVEAYNIADILAGSSKFICDNAGNGHYEETEYVINDVCETDDDRYVLTDAELKGYLA